MIYGLDPLCETLGYEFRNSDLLVRALTHRSWMAERGSSDPEAADNEQLEFLGDSILGFLVSESLVTRHPAVREGQLSQWKAHLVSATHLHDCAVEISLGDYLRLGKGEERNGGRARKTLLANAFEAVIAAMYLDGGIQPVRSFVETHVVNLLDTLDDVQDIERFNHKSVLQERTQAMGLPTPRYFIVETSGPEHAKVFTVEVRVGLELSCRAQGTSKKVASQRAAESLIEKLEAVESGRASRQPQSSAEVLSSFNMPASSRRTS